MSFPSLKDQQPPLIYIYIFAIYLKPFHTIRLLQSTTRKRDWLYLFIYLDGFYLLLFMLLLLYTLTGHFIRYTLLVPGWTPFAFRTALIHRFNKVLETFVGCTSMMWISRSTKSQRCSIGLISGDCGGYLSKVNSLSCWFQWLAHMVPGNFGGKAGLCFTELIVAWVV